jgi:hypothetical protein
MILPNKYLRISESFIGLSALFLDILKSDKLTIETLWNKFNKKYINKNKIKNKISYQKYIYVLNFMFLTGMISYTESGEIFNENIKS